MWRHRSRWIAALALGATALMLSAELETQAQDGPPEPMTPLAEQQSPPAELPPHVPSPEDLVPPRLTPPVVANAGTPKPEQHDPISVTDASGVPDLPAVTAGGIVGDAPGPGNVSATSSTQTFNASTEQGSSIDMRLLLSPFRYRYFDTGGLVALSGCVQIDGQTVECAAPNVVIVTAYLTDGNDVFYLNSLYPADSAAIVGGDGDDSFLIGAQATMSGFGTTYVWGDGGTNDNLYYLDSQTGTGSTYTIGATNVVRTNSGGTLHYEPATTETLAVHTSAGLDTINVDGVALNVTTEIYPTPINGDPYADVINVGTGGTGTLPGIVNMAGVAQDIITVFDATVGFDDYTITSNTVDTPGIGGLLYAGFGSLVINGQSSGDYIVSSTGSTAITINGSTGDDTFTVGDDLDALWSPLTINAGAGADYLLIDDRANGDTDPTTITFLAISQPGSAGISYSGFDGETMEVFTQNTGTTIYVDSTAATTYVKGNGGNDAIWAGGGAMTFLAGLANIDGGSGNDSVYVNDAFSGEHTYAVTSSGIGRSSSAGTAQTNVESISLAASPLDSTINVTGTAPGVSYTLDGGDGSDYYTVGDDLSLIQGPILLVGGNGFDQVYYSDTAATSGQTYEMRGGYRFDRIGSAPITLSFMDLEQLTASPHNDTLRLMSTTTGTTTIGAAGGGNDLVQVFAAGLSSVGVATVSGGANTDMLQLYTGALGSVIGPTQITGPFHHPVSYVEFESTSTASTAIDADGDSCEDWREVDTDPNYGGLRNPADFYDFFDVSGATVGSPRNGYIDLTDTLAVLGRFGETPPGPPYLPTFDRMPAPPFMPWRAQQATGNSVGIDLQDAIVSLQSFGHNCVED